MSEIVDTARLGLWSNVIGHGTDGADGTGSCFKVRIIVMSLI